VPQPLYLRAGGSAVLSSNQYAGAAQAYFTDGSEAFVPAPAPLHRVARLQGQVGQALADALLPVAKQARRP